jgi:hypothetical protein
LSGRCARNDVGSYGSVRFTWPASGSVLKKKGKKHCDRKSSLDDIATPF